MRRLIVVMGVSGCGKSTVGRALSKRYSWPFIEGDDHHPPANIAKMSKGVALDDSDRKPWIEAIVDVVDHKPDDTVILACSALTPLVQSVLMRVQQRDIVWLHLHADKALIRERMNTREHFMPASLLDSQFEALQLPPQAVQLTATEPLEALIDEIDGYLG